MQVGLVYLLNNNYYLCRYKQFNLLWLTNLKTWLNH
jgi:hypothetical protein